MKGMIKSNAEKEARTINEDYSKILKQYPFVEQKRPAPKLTPGAALPVEDYTTEKELKALMAKSKPLDDFTVPQELCVGLSATSFWQLYF